MLYRVALIAVDNSAARIHCTTSRAGPAVAAAKAAAECADNYGGDWIPISADRISHLVNSGKDGFA
jgi:hypothetical protein